MEIPEEFDEETDHLLTKVVKNNYDNDMAALLFHLTKDRFTHCEGRWYAFSKEHNKWRIAKDQVEMRRYMSQELWSILSLKMNKCHKDSLKNIERDSDKTMETIGIIHKIMNSVKMVYYKSRIIRESIEFFESNKFSEVSHIIAENKRLEALSNPPKPKPKPT